MKNKIYLVYLNFYWFIFFYIRNNIITLKCLRSTRPRVVNTECFRGNASQKVNNYSRTRGSRGLEKKKSPYVKRYDIFSFEIFFWHWWPNRRVLFFLYSIQRTFYRKNPRPDDGAINEEVRSYSTRNPKR